MGGCAKCSLPQYVALYDRDGTIVTVERCPWRSEIYSQEELIVEYANHSRMGRMTRDAWDMPAWLEDGRQALARFDEEAALREAMCQEVGDGR